MDTWVIGFALGAAVVVVVVVLLLALILLARRVAGRAEAIVAALQAARDNTTGLHEVWRTEQSVERVITGAERVRHAVEDRRAGR